MNDDLLTVPLSLTDAAAFISKYDNPNEPDDVLAEMSRAASAITHSARDISDTVTKVLSNQMNAPMKNAKMARDRTFAIFETTARRVDSTRARGEAIIAALEAETQPAKPKDAMEFIAAGEVRQMLRGMSAEERKATLAEADDTIISAVAHSHPRLSGITVSERDLAVHEWRKRRFPAELDRIERLRGALGQLDRLGTMYRDFSLRIANAKADEIAAAENSERAAKAALEAAG